MSEFALPSAQEHSFLGARRDVAVELGVTCSGSFGNGIFYGGLSWGRQREVPAVHFDHPSDAVTVVVYLSPGLAADCGPSHGMHRATGLADARAVPRSAVPSSPGTEIQR